MEGEELVQTQDTSGAQFLNIVSYAWLEKDAEVHLPRMVCVLKEKKAYLLEGTDKEDVGVILDCCTLGKEGGDADKHTNFQREQLKEGLTEVRLVKQPGRIGRNTYFQPGVFFPAYYQAGTVGRERKLEYNI